MHMLTEDEEACTCAGFFVHEYPFNVCIDLLELEQKSIKTMNVGNKGYVTIDLS